MEWELLGFKLSKSVSLRYAKRVTAPLIGMHQPPPQASLSGKMRRKLRRKDSPANLKAIPAEKVRHALMF